MDISTSTLNRTRLPLEPGALNIKTIETKQQQQLHMDVSCLRAGVYRRVDYLQSDTAASLALEWAAGTLLPNSAPVNMFACETFRTVGADASNELQ